VTTKKRIKKTRGGEKIDTKEGTFAKIMTENGSMDRTKNPTLAGLGGAGVFVGRYLQRTRGRRAYRAWKCLSAVGFRTPRKLRGGQQD